MVQSEAGEQYTLLITDDDRRCRETLRDVFEPRGYRTCLASDGEEAITIVRHERVHLVLLDMHMPRLNGLETLRRVKQINALLPCILLTGDTSEHLARQARIARAFDVINKPLSVETLLGVVAQAIRRFYLS